MDDVKPTGLVVVELRGHEANVWWDSQPGENSSTYFEEGEGEEDFDLYFQTVPGVTMGAVSPGVTVREASLDVAIIPEWKRQPAPLPEGLAARLRGEPGEEGLWGVPFATPETPSLDVPKYKYEIVTLREHGFIQTKDGDMIPSTIRNKPPGTALLAEVARLDDVRAHRAKMRPVERKLADHEAAREHAYDASIAKWNPADRAMRIGTKRIRLATGFPTLDAATRGGVPVGTVVVIGGAPGAGKTTTAIDLAHRFAVGGAHVAILAIDESADDIIIRLGQIIGQSREALEDGDPAAKEALVQHLRSICLMLADGDDEFSTLENVSAELASRANGGPSVLVVDSIQRLRVTGPHVTDARARIDAAVTAVKLTAKRDRHLIIATSELTRGAYRSKVQAEQVNDLAAFKESGGIEYGAQLALVLRSREGVHNVIDVSIPKNRLGTGRPSFALSLDTATATVAETAALAVLVDPILASAKARVRVLFEEKGPLYSGTKTRIASVAGGNRKNTMSAIEALLEEDWLGYDSRNLITRKIGSGPVPAGVS